MVKDEIQMHTERQQLYGSGFDKRNLPHISPATSRANNYEVSMMSSSIGRNAGKKRNRSTFHMLASKSNVPSPRQLTH